MPCVPQRVQHASTKRHWTLVWGRFDIGVDLTIMPISPRVQSRGSPTRPIDTKVLYNTFVQWTEFFISAQMPEEIPMKPTNPSNLNVERCIEACLQCLRWCSACVQESLTNDPSTMAECIRLCHECTPVCGACVTLLSGNSRFEHGLCNVCADICDACAAECGKYDHMATMKNCAEACRRCAESCREVAQSVRKVA
jgi:hypothetical protein